MGVNPVGWEESRPQMFGWQVVWVVECRGVPLNIIISYKVQEYCDKNTFQNGDYLEIGGRP